MSLSALFDEEKRQEALAKARAIRKKTKTMQEERGLETCFLAVGMATWTDGTSAATPQAPVVLRQLSIEPRRAASDDFVLRLTGDPEINPEEVAEAIRAATTGEVHLDSAVARQLTRRMTTPQAGLAALTAREREILTLIAHGYSNNGIATYLVISERTARMHVSNLLSKLQLSSRTQAALLAIREGLVSQPS